MPIGVRCGAACVGDRDIAADEAEAEGVVTAARTGAPQGARTTYLASPVMDFRRWLQRGPVSSALRRPRYIRVRVVRRPLFGSGR